MGGKSDAPDPPDPKKTSAAQTGTNVATAIANTTMGNVNQYGPTGSLEYTQRGTQNFTDPYTGKTYEIPQYSATTKLTPEQQAIFNQEQGAELGMATTANIAGRNLSEILGQKFNPQNLPERGEVPGQGDFSEDRQRVEQAILDRMAPQMEQDRQRMETQMANQGIGLGSEAWASARDDLSRAENDARLGAILAGGQEQSRMFGMGLDRFNAQNSLRAQSLQEQHALRNQPINEITALLSGSQVSMPNFQMNQPARIPTTDNAGLINANYGHKLDAWKRKNEASQSLWGNLIGAGASLGGAWMGM